MNRLIILGASGHGKVISDIAEKSGYTDIVFLDDNKNIKSVLVILSLEKLQMQNKCLAIRL